MLKIIDKHPRAPLNEGRNYQMGFGFLKKNSDTEFETAMPISPCKDYLNDVIYVETYNKPLGVYGFNYKPCKLFDIDPDFVYLGFKICPKHGTTSNYPNQEKDTENLAITYKNIEKLMNFVETQLKVKGKTKIMVGDNKTYVAQVPKYWVKYTYLISLYSLLVRMAQFWDGTGTAKEFLDTYTVPLDIYLWKGAKPKYDYLLENKLPEQSFTASTEAYTIHNYGILALPLPPKQEEVKK